MHRALNAALLVKMARNLKYVPAVVATVKNWPTYFLYYLGFKKGGGRFVLRNGATLHDREGSLSGTIAVVFVRKQYGDVDGKATIVDIGANVGTFTVYAASTNQRARVFAYEPVRANYEVLQVNVAANGLRSRVVTHNKGVASRTEGRTIYLSESPEHSLFESGQAGRSESIECLSLEDVLRQDGLETVDLLKINAEGAEYEILFSTPQSCLERIGEIRLEYHNPPILGQDLEALVRFMQVAGFGVKWLYKYKDGEGFVWFARSPAKPAR